MTGQSFRRSGQFLQDRAQTRESPGISGHQSNGPLQADRRFFEFFLQLQGVAHVEVRRGAIGLEVDGLSKKSNRLRELPLCREGGP